MAIPKRCDNCGKKLGKDGLLCATCQYLADRKVDAPVKEKEAARAKEQWARINAERATEAAEERAAHKIAFLTELLMNGGHVEKACKAAGVSRTAMGRYRDDDPDFATAWEAVQETNIERLESEADRRAMGYEIHEPLTYQGRLTGDVKVVQQYSDNLLMFRLKALRPEKYRDGPGAGKQLGANLSEDELNEALTKMIARRSKQQGVQVDQVSEEVS